ncbi:MAG: hypothetical protein H8E15_10735 [Planctomycetes bacterium]|nr:hypothetical protein [Planctomycetota bacterium]
MKSIRKSLRPVKRWFKRNIYRRWDLIVCVRDLDQPLVKLPRLRFDTSEVEIFVSKPEDAHYFDTPEWKHQHANFIDRCQNLPGFACMMGVIGGKLVSCGPFVAGPMYVKVLHHRFDPGPDGIYWFEGETLEEWRSRGVALVGMNWFFPRLEELTGRKKILTNYEMKNRPSRKLHDRYSFVPQYRLIWRKLGPFRWARRAEIPEDF